MRQVSSRERKFSKSKTVAVMRVNGGDAKSQKYDVSESANNVDFRSVQDRQKQIQRSSNN